MTQEGKLDLGQAADLSWGYKEHFGIHTNISSGGDRAGSSPIYLAEVTEVVKQHLNVKVPGMEEICPEILKALDIVELSWSTHLFNIAWMSGRVPMDWQTRMVVPFFKIGDHLGDTRGGLGVFPSNLHVFRGLGEGL